MTLITILKLGRVSNLPTVWTNALAGAVLAGGGMGNAVVGIAVALSLFYVGGMWLNDAFDAEIDARERANRPIPMGEAKRGSVFAIGFALLVAGMAFAFAFGQPAGGVGIALAASVILYDWLHKRTVLSPVIMGVTRFLCYGLAAAAVGVFTDQVLYGALGLMAYVIGLTYAAKQEAYDRIGSVWPLAVLLLPVAYALFAAGSDMVVLMVWAGFVAVVLFALRLLFRRRKGDVPRAVVTMIAGMSLYDATLIAATGQGGLALLAIAGFVVTLILQRVVPGT